MGCVHSNRVHLNDQTSAIIEKYHINQSIVINAYDWFSKLRAKADYNLSPVQIANQSTITVKYHDVRSSLGVPHSIISDHILDLIDDVIDEHETLSFPMFLELLIVFALASHDQLVEFAYHSFSVDASTGLLAMNDLSEGLTDISTAYLPIVNGRPLAVNSFMIIAKTFLSESIKHSRGSISQGVTRDRAASSPIPTTTRPTSPPSDAVHSLAPSESQTADEASYKFNYMYFSLLIRRHAWLLDELRVMQLSVHRKLGGSRVWQQQRGESSAFPEIVQLLDERMRRQRSNKKKHAATKHRHSHIHVRRASVMPSTGFATRHLSHHTSEHTGRESPLLTSVKRIDSLSKNGSPPVSSLTRQPTNQSVNQSMPHSIVKRPHQINKSPRESMSPSTSSRQPEIGPNRQASMSLPGAINSRADHSHHALNDYSSNESINHPVVGTHTRVMTSTSIGSHHSPDHLNGGFRPSLRTRMPSKDGKSSQSPSFSSTQRSLPDALPRTPSIDASGHPVNDQPVVRHAHHGHTTRTVKRSSLQTHSLTAHAEEPSRQHSKTVSVNHHPIDAAISCPHSFSSVAPPYVRTPSEHIISPPPRRPHHTHHVSRSHNDDAHGSLRAAGVALISDSVSSGPPINQQLIDATRAQIKAANDTYLRRSLIGADSTDSIQEENLIKMLQTPLPDVPTNQLAPLDVLHTTRGNALRPRSSSTSVNVLTPSPMLSNRPVIHGRARSSSVLTTIPVIRSKA